MSAYDYEYNTTMECRDNGVLRGVVKNSRGYYFYYFYLFTYLKFCLFIVIVK